MDVYKNGSLYALGGQQTWGSGGQSPVVMVALTTYLNAGEYLETWKSSPSNLNGQTGSYSTWASFNYLGSG